MPISLLFWILYILALVFGFAWNRGILGPYGPWGGGLLIFILIGLLGWHDFGAAIHN